MATARLEALEAMAAQDIEDLRYHRMGYINQGRKSDKLLADFLALCPGDGTLPLRWHYRGYENFLAKHGHRGRILWAASNNSHLLLINGFHVLRIWHDTAKSCYVDVADNVAGNLCASMAQTLEPIPTSNWKKSAHFAKRLKVWQLWQIKALYDAVKRAYGLDHERLPVLLRP